MQTTDMAIKYKALYQAAELMIANIKEIGFDVTKYQNELKNISHNVNGNVKVSYSKGFARANYEMDYSNGIMALNKLIARLDKYDVYFKVLNSCQWLNMRIKDNHVTEQQLKEYVSEMAYNLKQIVKSDTMDYENEKHIVEMVYETAYKLVKLELVMTGASMLYDYIKKEDINVSYFNVIVKKELLKLNLSDRDNAFIKQRLFEIRKSGINSNYFDLDIIKGLIINDGDNSFKITVNENINALLKKIKANQLEIRNLVRKYEEDNDYSRKEYMDDIKSNKKEIRKRLISFLLATSMMVGGGIGLQKLVKRDSTGDKYLQTIETYSTITGETTIESDEVFLGNAPSNETIVRVYDSYESAKRREYHEYDVSYLDFDKAHEYYDYGVDNYEVVSKDGVLKSGNGDIISNYENSYAEVIKKTYEYLGVDFNQDEYDTTLVLGYIFYIIVWCVLGALGCVMSDNDLPVIIGSIMALYEETTDLLFNQKEYKLANEKANRNISKMLELINQNDELRNEFNRLYEANKYLLDNPEELYQKFSELDDSKVKKLIKENKNKR